MKLSSILDDPQEAAMLVCEFLIFLTQDRTDQYCRETIAYLLALLTTPVNADNKAYVKSVDDYTARAQQYLDKTFPPNDAQSPAE